MSGQRRNQYTHMLICGSFRTENVSSNLEAEVSCEKCVTSYQTKRRHILEDNHPQSYCHDNVKLQNIFQIFVNY